MGMTKNEEKSKEEINVILDLIRNDMTYIMISNVAVFVVCHLMYPVLNILLVLEIIKPKYGSYMPLFTLLQINLKVFSASINTLIYCIFSEKFRKILFQWVFPKCWQPKTEEFKMINTSHYYNHFILPWLKQNQQNESKYW